MVIPRGYDGDTIGGAAVIVLLYDCSAPINHEFGKNMARLRGTDTGVVVLFSNEKVCLISHGGK
jgi:hypothetical protein